jgi:hypothetical protein
MPVEVARGAGQDDCVRALDASTNLCSQKAEGVSYQWLVDDSACAAEDGDGCPNGVSAAETGAPYSPPTNRKTAPKDHPVYTHATSSKPKFETSRAGGERDYALILDGKPAFSLQKTEAACDPALV